MLLQYAFEKLGCISVELRTDFLKAVSRQVIQRLSVKQDGILRYHKIIRWKDKIHSLLQYYKTRMETGKRKSNIKLMKKDE